MSEGVVAVAGAAALPNRAAVVDAAVEGWLDDAVVAGAGDRGFGGDGAVAVAGVSACCDGAVVDEMMGYAAAVDTGAAGVAADDADAAGASATSRNFDTAVAVAYGDVPGRHCSLELSAVAAVRRPPSEATSYLSFLLLLPASSSFPLPLFFAAPEKSSPSSSFLLPLLSL